jgi:hypothetical protein
MTHDLHTLKDQELELFNAALDDDPLRYKSPDYYLGGLEAHARTLLRLGVIEAAECSDLVQQAQAAYSDVVERLALDNQ